MLKGFFFDLYGTIFTFGNMKKAWGNWLKAFYLSLQQYGLRITLEEFSLECNNFMSLDEYPDQNNTMTIFENRINYLCKSLKINLIKNDLRTIADIIVDEWQKEIKLDEDAIPVLKELGRSKKLVLVSNFDHPRHVRKYLSYYKLTNLFDSIIISGEVGVKKPNPEIFKSALLTTNLKASEVAFIGDADEDIEAGNGAGMMSILINRPDINKNEIIHDYHSEYAEQMEEDYNILKADIEISSMRELLLL